MSAGLSTASAANKFVLFTGRRTGFIMITGGCSNLHKSELTITVKRLICKGKRVDSSGAKTSASLPTGRRGVQNDTGGENTEKEGSNLRAARTQWAKVEKTSGRKDENADRLSVALRRGRRRGGVGGSRRQRREAISGSLAALCRD